MQHEGLKPFAYAFAGLSMMLNIRLTYSAAPYALIRFKLPENLFSVFVRTMAGALELWCLPSMVIGNIIDLIDKYVIDKGHKTRANSPENDAEFLKIKAGKNENEDGTLRKLALELYNAANKLKTAAGGGDSGAANALATEVGENEGTSGLTGALKALGNHQGTAGDQLTQKAEAVKDQYKVVEAAFNAVKEKEKAYKDKAKYQAVVAAWNAFDSAYKKFDKKYIRYQSIFWMWANFVTFVILFIVFVTGGDEGHVTGFYWVMAVSGIVFGINMVFVYSMELEYIVWYLMGENTFPVVTSFMHYVSILLFGNRRKWNTDFIAVNIDIAISICIAFIASAIWTYCYIDHSSHSYWEPSKIDPAVISPLLMVLIGMGLVFTIYPAIAPGMIVPFYLIDKIEMILLILTCFPPVIIAILRKQAGFDDPMSPMCKWNTSKTYGVLWHLFDLLMVIKITLAYIFIYSIHYRESNISRSIVNQPKMSTALSIIFYMCHECLLAIGFPGMVGNSNDIVILPTQLVGAFAMVFLGFVCNGYIIEYKSHDPAHWPTDGMTRWNAFCFWCKKTSKNTNKILASIFTTDLSRTLALFDNFFYLSVC